jgi:hypothetical protein
MFNIRHTGVMVVMMCGFMIVIMMVVFIMMMCSFMAMCDFMVVIMVVVMMMPILAIVVMIVVVVVMMMVVMVVVLMVMLMHMFIFFRAIYRNCHMSSRDAAFNRFFSMIFDSRDPNLIKFFNKGFLIGNKFKQRSCQHIAGSTHFTLDIQCIHN